MTEFLPISSSGHLILVPQVSGWPDQGLTIDVAAHVGTLLAVLVYFWRDMWNMCVGLTRLVRGRLDAGGKLLLFLIAATIPALAIGYLLDKYVNGGLRSAELVAWALIGFGVLLFVADRLGMTICRLSHMTFVQAVIIGVAQTLAFIPGTSRSGITMIAARIMGFERAEAARFSFLLSIPAISAAGLWKGRELLSASDPALLKATGLTVAFSAVAGFLAIAFLMAWLRRATFAPFVVYRIALGCLLLWLIYSGTLDLSAAP